MVPLTCMAVLMAAGTLVVPVASQDSPPCPWLISSDSGCVESVECTADGDGIYIWEDCSVGDALFTINDPEVSLNDCAYASGSPIVYLTKELDAEDPANPSCTVQGRPELFFIAVNINEVSPRATKDTVPIIEVYVDENKKVSTAEQIYYTDDDKDETINLSCTQISQGYSDIFSLTPVDGVENNIKTFTFSVNKKLDYESQVFYKMEYNIISTDEKGNKMNTKQTFFVYVNDLPDNAPFWSDIEPVWKLSECQPEKYLFNVTAQDRDVAINYDIQYSMVQDSGDYFEIDVNTGDVSRKKEIDREELLESGISSFSLTITATEYKDINTPGEEPNNREQVTIVTILDCNDQWPTFDKETYRITMDELTEDSKDQDLDVQIKVQDMDEGDNGSFTLTTSNAEFLGITPNGKQSQDVTLTAKWLSDNNNYFNYEIHKSKPFNFKITATEDGEPSHTTTATVTITLRDVNDNSPIFHSSPYTTSIKESKPMNSVLLTVEAEDDDVRDDFGKPSIRYSLELSCHQLKIDNTTGIVTLASELDYDGINPDKEINCNVNARDNNGTGLSGTSKIIISVIDVVDEIPWIQDSEILMTIKENSAQGADVGTFIVNDLDQAANINFTIVSSVCSSGTSGPTDVDGWFSVVSGPPSNPQYPAQVKVTGHIDREACREVTLNVMAVDWETDANEDSVNVNVVITVQDVKDEAPQFTGDYGDLSIDEMTEAATGSVVVFLLTVSDPDEGDTIHLAISKGAEQMELSETSVTVEEGGEAKVDVRTKKDTIIDRETHEYIEVEITLTNDEHQPTQHRTFTIKINDLNDNTPEMTSDSCDVETIHVLEDDGTGSVNGTSIHNITAIDDDIDSPFNTVSYLMVNDQLTDSKNLQTPFTVDELTGEVRVLLIPDKKSLNREQYTDWELIFTAADRCRQPQELNCKVLQSDQCRVKITVDDINDNDPRNLVWTPQGKITVTDFLQEDEDIGYTLSATDDDVGKNATLTYTVLSTVPLHGNEDRMLFYTKNQHIGGVSSCSLHGSQDFKGKNYTGTYNVTLQAMDGGNRTAEFPIDIIVEDANDQTPEFVFYGCEGELNVNTIKMDENAYKPGVENNPDFMEVKCYSPKGPTFTIGVQDDDFMDKNKEVTAEINEANSTVENAAEEDKPELLSYWRLEPDYFSTNGYRLQLSHQIDREKGSAYNLSLHVINTAEPHLESWGWVRVVIKNIQEDDPYFCPDGSCYQDVYMYENNPKAEIYFLEATDKDNIFAHPGDDEYDLVYYYIVGGDRSYFKTANKTDRKIILKDILPDGLDREGKQNYSIEIFASNDDNGDDIIITDPTRNDVLHLTILVGDVNDEEPIFDDDVIFSSFMESNSNEDSLITIKARDPDLNETLVYTILDDLEWYDTDYKPDRSFILERKDARSVNLKLDFDPKGMEQGYCNFTISVEDAVGHRDETQVKVYVINEHYQVAMFFSNTVEDIKNKQSEIEDAYTDAYGYSCVVDSITATQTDTGETLVNATTVYMHFINVEKNEPVEDNIILDLSDNADVMKELHKNLDDIEINLESVNTYMPPVNEHSLEDTILTLKILLSVVALVMGSLLVLLISVYCIRTKSLARKVKVLSTNTFGSKESGLNHMGIDMVTVPGSNFTKVHGNQNPVFNENGAFETRNQQDTGSISSGGSDLIGVEDNPEFKSYAAEGGPRTTPARGYENPSFGRSIDEVSAAPPGVQGGTKGNPLLNLGNLQDDSSTNSSLKPRASLVSDGSEGDGKSLDGSTNSNFFY